MQSTTIKPKQALKSRKKITIGISVEIVREAGSFSVTMEKGGRGATEHEYIFLDSKSVLVEPAAYKEPDQAALGTPWSAPPIY